MATILRDFLTRELNAEYKATKACLEKIPEDLYEYKPHPTSMAMGYLTVLVAEIPRWIKHIVQDGEIVMGSFQHEMPKDNAAMLKLFEENMKNANAALKQTTDEQLIEETFTLRSKDQVFYTAKKIIDVSTSLNHWVHHRGQLTVYMRMNEIPVPSIYGPSADDKSFTTPT